MEPDYHYLVILKHQGHKIPNFENEFFLCIVSFDTAKLKVVGICAHYQPRLNKLHSYTIYPTLLSAALAAYYLFVRHCGSVKKIEALCTRTTTLLLLLTYTIITTVSALALTAPVREKKSMYHEDSYLSADYTVIALDIVLHRNRIGT